MTITAPTPLNARPACAAPEHLALVDAAFDRHGDAGFAAREALARLCRHCPVAAVCLEYAMTHPELGVWGGATARERNRAGAPPITNKANLRGVHRDAA